MDQVKPHERPAVQQVLQGITGKPLLSDPQYLFRLRLCKRLVCVSKLFGAAVARDVFNNAHSLKRRVVYSALFKRERTVAEGFL